MEKIAIIGVANLFPGSKNLDEFWSGILAAKDFRSVVSDQKLQAHVEQYYGKDKSNSDKFYCAKGGYITDFKFEPDDFEINPLEVSSLDDVYLWSLYVAKEALKDAGYWKQESITKNCGLILGNLSFPTKLSNHIFIPIYHLYVENLIKKLTQNPSFKLKPFVENKKINPLNAFMGGYPASFVAKVLKLSPHSYTIDAACATSLYAVKLACDYLISRKSDLMLAGSVSAADPFFVNMGFSTFQAYPKNGISAPLEGNSQGLFAGEGAGMFLLKRYQDAIDDNDKIYSIILGGGLSNDGKGQFVLSPRDKGQYLAYQRAYESTGVDPNTIRFIECHATGTPLGDKVELNSLESFFSDKNKNFKIGSVKSNLGHLLTTAGMPSMLKAIQILRTSKIPPTINIEASINSKGNFINKEKIPVETIQLDVNEPNLRVAVNSFGFGGCNAHLIFEKNSDAPKTIDEKSVSDFKKCDSLAVIGMDAHFGKCKDLTEFYMSIYNGEQNFIDLPKKRWKGLEQDKKLLNEYGLDEAPIGAYIEDFDFDFLKYKIPPTEDDQLIPQQLLMMKVADRAIQDADLKMGQRVSVIIAMSTDFTLHQYRSRANLSTQLKVSLSSSIGKSLSESEYIELENILKDSIHNPSRLNQSTSFIGNIMASRISSLWDFSGPAFTLSSEENSVIKAIEVAKLILKTNQADAVVLGAVDLSGSAENVLVKNKMNPIHKGNPVSGFDKTSNGWLVGEGAGAIVLVNANDSKAETNYATIDGIGLSNLQDKEAVASACNDALHEAGIEPSKVSLIECHSSGIENEDRLEINGLMNSKYGYKDSKYNIAISSVKANIGHTYAASGMASLIKTILCLHYKFIPKMPNWHGPKLEELWKDSTFYAPEYSRTWFVDHANEKRIASLNSISHDGVAGNIVLSEGGRKISNQFEYLQNSPISLFLISGDSQDNIQAQLDILYNDVSSSSDLSNLATQYYNKWKIQSNNHNNFYYSISVVGKSKSELLSEINSAKKGVDFSFVSKTDWNSPAGSCFTVNPLGKTGKVASVYPGGFATYIGVASDLFQIFPQLYNQMSKYTSRLRDMIAESFVHPRDIKPFTKEDISNRIKKLIDIPNKMFETGILLAVLYTDIMKEFFSLKADYSFGYSMGEVSMMFAQGVWPRMDTMHQKAEASPVFQTRLAGPMETIREAWKLPKHAGKDEILWVYYTIKSSPEKVKAVVQNSTHVFLVLINNPSEVVIAGHPDSCKKAIEIIGCESFFTPISDVIHCELVKSEYHLLKDLHYLPAKPVNGVKFFSASTYGKIEIDSESIADHIAKMYCKSVDFPKLVNTVYNDGARIFIELGPRDSCSNNIKAILNGKDHLVLSINRKNESDKSCLIRAISKLVTHQVNLNLDALYKNVESHDKKSLVKKVCLGGEPIENFILSHDNIKSIFKNMNNSILDQTNTNTSKGENMESEFKNIVVWDQQDLVEFAEGKIANVFGNDYAIIDSYHRRVRLPTTDYLLVSRVTKLDATMNEYKPSSMTTEYDIPYKAWYSIDGQIPCAITVESGQCDLLLISYLGIDFQNKGERVYRLLDSTLTFLDDFPKEGQTLRYDIKINNFAKSGDNLLFFFSYECFVGDKMILKMDGGCAGFFSDKQLAHGKGVVCTQKELKEKQSIVKQSFTPLLQCSKNNFNREEILQIITGNISGCFGSQYDQKGYNPSLRFATEKMLMIDSVTSVDPKGGAWGLGFVSAEKVLAPDHWYFPCHFKDDQVLAGSLMSEGCTQLLQFYLLYLGLQTKTKDARFQPVYNLPQKVRCRGQVIPQHAKLVYRMEVKEIGLDPAPYAKADVDIILDGKVIVDFKDLGVQLLEKKHNDPSLMYEQKIENKDENTVPGTLPFTQFHYHHFAVGTVSQCFGPEYSVYDNRPASRTPNGDLQLVSRIVDIKGVRYNLKEPSTVVAEYDVPHDAWYYVKNSHPAEMPYSVLMEIALQPTGFISAYMGTTLSKPDKDFYYRNLDGTGDLKTKIDLRGKRITNVTKLVSTVSVANTIIQKFEFELTVDGNVFYSGTAVFGHFLREALALQFGIDNGKKIPPWYIQQNVSEDSQIRHRLDSQESKSKFYEKKQGKPYYRLAGGQLEYLDEVIIVENGGESNKGYIYGFHEVDPDDWFYPCHFFCDPVMPGSLGVEAILEAMQIFMIQNGYGDRFKSPHFTQRLGKTIWKYRGQIIPANHLMSLEVHIKEIQESPDSVTVVADANLYKDGLRIYAITDAAVVLMES